jgi:hypothetical protein
LAEIVEVEGGAEDCQVRGVWAVVMVA